MSESIKLRDVPVVLLPVLTSTKRAKLWLNGNEIDEIFIFRNREYRINTNRGQYRFPLDIDIDLDITS